MIIEEYDGKVELITVECRGDVLQSGSHLASMGISSKLRIYK